MNVTQLMAVDVMNWMSQVQVLCDSTTQWSIFVLHRPVGGGVCSHRFREDSGDGAGIGAPYDYPRQPDKWGKPTPACQGGIQ